MKRKIDLTKLMHLNVFRCTFFFFLALMTYLIVFLRNEISSHEHFYIDLFRTETWLLSTRDLSTWFHPVKWQVTYIYFPVCIMLLFVRRLTISWHLYDICNIFQNNKMMCCSRVTRHMTLCLYASQG